MGILQDLDHETRWFFMRHPKLKKKMRQYMIDNDVSIQEAADTIIKKHGKSASRQEAAKFRNNRPMIGRSINDIHNCEICDFLCKPILEAHHKKPVKCGGSGQPYNIIMLCPNCHAILDKLNKGEDLENWLKNNYSDEIQSRFYALIFKGSNNNG